MGRDILGVGSIGLRTRKLRAALSALGIAIGIASMVAVLGLSASSQAELLNTIDQLGTNLLTVQAGQSFFGASSQLPVSAGPKLKSIPGVQTVASTYSVSGATVRRTQFVDPGQTGGISVAAADPNLVSTVSVRMASGHFLGAATSHFPTVVLGATAAQRLGIDTVSRAPQVYINGRWFEVIGILAPVTLAPELDTDALIGLPVAERVFATVANPTNMYLRADDSRVVAVQALIAPTANPENPDQVQVSRPSNALEARAAAKGAFTSLLLGLGAVALLVGGVGIANVMVISVLERRSEIGLRRALGAARRHISTQFLTEALLLAAGGGLAGTLIGAAVTAVYSNYKHQPTVVPAYALAGGMLAALAIGVVAGLYPAMRASRLSPTEALRAV